jgi:S-adenosylmethionine hydrolase
MSAIVTLTSDFGLVDAYVAAMKGVILGINPDARLVDICHNIQPQNVSQAAYVLKTAYTFFPQKTVHLVVVDPGVGSERQAVILKTLNAYFVAPDNGILSHIIAQHLAKPLQDEATPQQPGRIKLLKAILTREVEAVAITNTRFFHTPVSPTFHGRDIMAPVAALLSLGLPPIQFGQPLSVLAAFPLPRPDTVSGGVLVGHILHIDSFGNLITDIQEDDLHSVDGLTVEVAGRRINGLVNTYAEGRGLLALIGSSGHLEVALRDASACSILSVRVGDEVIIRPPSKAK